MNVDLKGYLQVRLYNHGTYIKLISCYFILSSKKKKTTNHKYNFFLYQ